MNNNYFGFNPNLMRSVPYTNIVGSASSLPRSSFLGGLLGSGARSAATGASRITFSGILNGASKTLGVINQAIPVFYQVKPVFNNARTMFRVAKEINRSNKTSNVNTNTIENEEVLQKTQKNKENNSPTFFI